MSLVSVSAVLVAISGGPRNPGTTDAKVTATADPDVWDRFILSESCSCNIKLQWTERDISGSKTGAFC